MSIIKRPNSPNLEAIHNSPNKKSKLTESIEAILTCNACKNLFTNPITLPCGHSFCTKCISI